MPAGTITHHIATYEVTHKKSGASLMGHSVGQGGRK